MSAREWHLGFGCGSKWAVEEVLGLMPYFRVLAVPAMPQHDEVTITSVREAFSNSKASQKLFSQRSFVLGEGGTQEHKKKFFLSYLFFFSTPQNENHM